MIQIDFKNQTYICPFCGHVQAFYSSHDSIQNGRDRNHITVSQENEESSFTIHTFYCNNNQCKQASVTAINRTTKQQIDILPRSVIKQWPTYIPEQIRKDYEEACLIVELSPKASATLLRRCLQGMIHDYWDIHEKNLNAEITALKGKVTPTQWKALDGLRKIGNIGAHMESDVNLIIDIDSDETKSLLKLIELLMEKWYVARHDEEELFENISAISAEKDNARKQEK